MKVKKLYYSDLFVEENVGDVEQRKDLLSLILKMRDKSLDTKDVKLNSNLSNTNCYRFGFSMINEEFNLKWLLDEIKKLIEKATNHYYSIDDYFMRELNKTKMKLEFTSWVNINEPGSKNVLHAHKNSSFAVVYYLQGIDTGNLIFRNPSNLLSDCSNTSPFVRGIAHTPKDGDLVLWPAWLPHEVEENKSDRQRINITSNINIG